MINQVTNQPNGAPGGSFLACQRRVISVSARLLAAALLCDLSATLLRHMHSVSTQQPAAPAPHPLAWARSCLPLAARCFRNGSILCLQQTTTSGYAAVCLPQGCQPRPHAAAGPEVVPPHPTNERAHSVCTRLCTPPGTGLLGAATTTPEATQPVPAWKARIMQPLPRPLPHPPPNPQAQSADSRQAVQCSNL